MISAFLQDRYLYEVQASCNFRVGEQFPLPNLREGVRGRVNTVNYNEWAGG